MNDLTVRTAEERDIKPIAELDKLCFQDPWSEKSFHSEIMENEAALYIVGEIDGGLVGYAGVWAIVDEGHITNVAVHPDYRKKGIGEILVAVMIESCEKEGIFRQTLEVRPSNEAALKLYGKFGFKAVGRRKGYYADNGEDALIMWRDGGIQDV